MGERNIDLSFRERFFRPFFRPFVRTLATKKNFQLFEAAPAEFFVGLTSDTYRRVGKVFFGGVAVEAQPVVADSPSKKNVLVSYNYSRNGPLGPKFKLNEEIREGYAVLLIERIDSHTKQEESIYSWVSENRNNLYCLRPRQLHRVLLDDMAEVAEYSTEGRIKVVDRCGTKGTEIISKFSFMLVVNPKTDAQQGFKSLGSNIYVIAIFTPDFDLSLIREELLGIDLFIGAKEIAGTLDYPLRRFIDHTEFESQIAQLEQCLTELTPRDRYAYIQTFGVKKMVLDLFHREASRDQVVLYMSVAKDDLPFVTSDFCEYITRLSVLVDRIYVTDYVFFRYKNWLLDMDVAAIAAFLELASQDGIRFTFECLEEG